MNKVHKSYMRVNQKKLASANLTKKIKESLNKKNYFKVLLKFKIWSIWFYNSLYGQFVWMY